MTDDPIKVSDYVKNLPVEHYQGLTLERIRNRISLAGQVKLNDNSGISGVLIVIAKGDKEFKTITANNGCFCFINLPGGEYTPKVYKVKTDSRKIGKGDEDKELFITRSDHNISVEENTEKWQYIFINIGINFIIEGRITDENNNPLKAKVKIKGALQSILSNDMGKYQMVLDDFNLFLQGSITLEVSAIDYNILTQNVKWKLNEKIKNTDLQLTKKDNSNDRPNTS